MLINNISKEIRGAVSLKGEINTMANLNSKKNKDNTGFVKYKRGSNKDTDSLR